MKKPALFLFLCFAFSIVSAQEIIENPEKPLNKDAGRALELEEEMRITDEGGDFYFSMPRSLKISENGCIYIVDENQFLKFSPDGKFITNLYKQGKGPGEIDSLFYYVFEKNDVFILDWGSQKIIPIDEAGLFGEDIKLNDSYNDLLGFYENHFILVKRTSRRFEGPGELYEQPHTFYLVNRKGEVVKTYPVITRRVFIYERGASFIDPFFAVLGLDRKSLFINNSNRYKISVLDLGTGKISRIFSRQYESVKRDPKGRISPAVEYGGPKREYFNDASNMFPLKKSLWIRTSTRNSTGLRLYDVFDYKGRFIDSVYINTSGVVFDIFEDFVFVKEEDSDGFISLVKYKILDKDHP